MTNGTTLIATAHFITEHGSETEHFWGDVSPEYMERIREWFRKQSADRGRDLVGAYLYVRAGVFSANTDYHKPTKFKWMKAEHIHVGM